MRSPKLHKRRRAKELRYWFDFDAFSDLYWSLEQSQFKPLEDALQGATTHAEYRRGRVTELRASLAGALAKVDSMLAMSREGGA